jgi:Cu/Ag efflux protein CusF
MDSRSRPRGGSVWSVVLGLALGLCAVEPAVAGPSFNGQGRVTAVSPDGSTVTIEHGGVPGLLPPARSEFRVQGAGSLQGVRPGDRVRFTLGAEEESHGLLTVQSVTPEAGRGGGLDPILVSVVVALALLLLAVVGAGGVGLWRDLRVLHRRVVALDHEAATLRGLVTDTQDAMRQMARALDDAVMVLRVGYVQELRRRLVPEPVPRAADGADGGDASGPTHAVVVVQRGRGELYHAVERGIAGPGLAVMWDRRRAERRRSVRRAISEERRRTERRGTPPETWTRLGFQLVPAGGADAALGPAAARPAGGELRPSR